MELILTATPSLNLSQKLKLQTCRCSDIDNEQVQSMSVSELNIYKRIEGQHPFVIFKQEPTGYYNCHGMTFASRRTGIYNHDEIEKILKEDNYIEIKEVKNVLAGDIVLYYEGNGVSHSGIIMSVDVTSHLVSIMVLSKWGRNKEAIHNLNDSPYSSGLKKFFRVNHGFKIV